MHNFLQLYCKHTACISELFYLHSAILAVIYSTQLFGHAQLKTFVTQLYKSPDLCYVLAFENTHVCDICFAEEFILEDPKTYTFLTNGALPVPGVDDASEFQATVKAMSIMGMTNEDLSGEVNVGTMYCVCCIINCLHLMH